jgi:hypothetical protein
MREIELIHLLDLGDLLNKLADVPGSAVDIYKAKGSDGVDIIELPKSGRRFIQSIAAPRKTFDIE